MAETKLANFLSSPLMAWVRTYEDRYRCNTVVLLADGILLNHIMQQIYPDSSTSMVNTEINGDANLRAQNLTILMQSIRHFFENYLQQLIVMQLPDIMAIAYEPESDYSLDQLEKILLLMLGCGVQCEAKEKLIENIKKMDSNLQSSLVVLIQEITHNADNVYSMDFEGLSTLQKKDLEAECQNAYIRLKRVTRERDNYYASFSEAAQEKNHFRRELLETNGRPPSSPLGGTVSRTSLISDATAVGLIASQTEVAELRTKLRDVTDQMDLKSLSLTESHKEIIMLQEKITKVQQEKQRMMEEVQWSRDHHDELDSLRLKARRIDQLETDNSKLRRKQEDMEHVTKLIKEVKNEKRLLVEGNKSLEAEVERLNSRFSALDDVEMENAQLQQQVRALTEAKESDMEQLQVLMEQNARLELNGQQYLDQIEDLRQELDNLKFATPAGSVTPSLGNVEFNLAQAAQEKSDAELLQSRLASLERDNRELDRAAADLRETKARLSTLETQNKTMQSQRFGEQKELAIAREELKREREKVKEAVDEKKKFREDLQRQFAQREHQVQGQLIEEKRKYLELEQRVDDVAQQKSEVAQDRIASLEARLDLSEKEKLQLRNDLTSASEELAVVSVKLVTANQELRSTSDKLVSTSEEVAMGNDRLRLADDQLEEEKHRADRLERQNETEKTKAENLTKLLREERVRREGLEITQSETAERVSRYEQRLNEERQHVQGSEADQEQLKRRVETLEQKLAEERRKAEVLREERKAEEIRTAEVGTSPEVQNASALTNGEMTEVDQNPLAMAPSPMSEHSRSLAVPVMAPAPVRVEQSNACVQTTCTESREMACQTEVELWLEQVVALAQARGFLGGPDEEETVPEDQAETGEDDASENAGKPMQAVAPVKMGATATPQTTPITPSFVTAELTKSASTVKATKVITPRAAASLLLSSSPALTRAVSSLIASPGSSPLLSRTMKGDTITSKSSTGLAIVPAVVGVVESIRGVMETVGTPTTQQRTTGGTSRQEEAADVQQTLNFSRGDSPTLGGSDDPLSVSREQSASNLNESGSYDPEGLQAELKRMKTEYSALESQLNSIKRQYQGEQADLESEIRNLRRQLHASKMQISELNDELGRVRKQLRTAHQQSSSMEDELNHSRHQVQSTRQQWQEARQQLHAAGAQLQVAQMTNHQLETHSSQIEANNEALSNRCDALEQMSSNLSEEIRNLYAEVKKLLLENRELRMKNDEAKDKFIDDERVFSDRLAELENERGRLNEQLDTIKKTKKKKSALSKVAHFGKKAKNLLGGEKDRRGHTKTDGYDSSSSGSGAAGSVPQSMSMPRFVARDRADTLPVPHAMSGSGSLESFGGSLVQLAGVRKARSMAGSLNDAVTVASGHSHEDEDGASQLEQLMSGLARMDSPSTRASIATSSPASRQRGGGEVVTLEDFLKETDKTPVSRRRMFNEVLVDSPTESRRLSSNAPLNPSALAAGGMNPRREVAAIDAPAFLESLKTTPLRQQSSDNFRRQKPIHQGRATLRQGSVDSRASSQNSNDIVPGMERSASTSAGSPSVNASQTHVPNSRRFPRASSASSIDSHNTAPSPLTTSHTHVGAAMSAGTPPLSRSRDSQGSFHQPLTRTKALADGASVGSNPLDSSGSVNRTSTPSSGAASASSRCTEDGDVMTAMDAIMTAGPTEPTFTLEPPDGSAAPLDPSPTIIQELQQSPTRLSPANQRRSVSGRSSPQTNADPPPSAAAASAAAAAGAKPEDGENNAESAKWFEYGCV
ncbi:protein Daple-like [Sycon ciliatum]|uniref:protein Daple-like n=1 Tax=Sycon ciliatum TaxID=27933 RepID=UPI0031F6B03C